MPLIRSPDKLAAAHCVVPAQRWAESLILQRPNSDAMQRGEMYSVQVPELGELVRKHYFRGGLMAQWNRDHYLYTGEQQCRSFHEFGILQRAEQLGLPVPRAVAALYWRNGLSYQAELYTQRIPQALSLQQLISMETVQQGHFLEAGRCIRHFHDAGLWHADMNAMNLVFDADDRCWLLDFDRAQWREPKAGWKHQNLNRLQRSIHKICQRDGLDFPTFYWQELTRAWQQS